MVFGTTNLITSLLLLEPNLILLLISGYSFRERDREPLVEYSRHDLRSETSNSSNASPIITSDNDSEEDNLSRYRWCRRFSLDQVAGLPVELVSAASAT